MKYLQPAYPCSSSSSLLSWTRPGSAGLQARQVSPASLQQGSQYRAPQSGSGQGRCRGVSGVPHKVHLRRKQRRSQGQRRRHHCSSDVPCGEDGPVWARAERPQGQETVATPPSTPCRCPHSPARGAAVPAGLCARAAGTRNSSSAAAICCTGTALESSPSVPAKTARGG